MVICAKTAELIEMPFGLWTWVSPRKHVLHGAAHWRHLANTIEPSMFSGPTKIDEPVKNPFGVWTWVGAKNHILDGVQIAPCQGAIFRGKDTKDILGMSGEKSCCMGVHSGTTWQIRFNSPCSAALQKWLN